MAILVVNFIEKYLQNVLVNINEKNKIDYLITNKEKFMYASKFKDTEILDIRDYYFPHLVKKLNINNKESLSKDLIDKFSSLENLFLTISDRMSFFPISVHKRKRLYYELLLYWITFFKKNSIDLILFNGVPHMGWDNIIYDLAKYFNIKTLYIELTVINDRTFINEDYLKIPKIPLNYLKNSSKDEINKLLDRAYLDDVFIDGGAIAVGKQRNIESNKKFYSKLFDIFKKKPTLKSIGRYILYKAYGITKLFSKKLTSPLFFNGEYRLFFINTFKILMSLKSRKLKNFYNKSVSNLNYQKKYIFFSLHHQPEKTSLPMGTVFENQILAIEILSKSIPKNWVIYVKEHPTQFYSGLLNLKNKHYREIEDYKKLLSFPNVRFVKLTEDSGKLIKNSIATSTITGTVGWESLSRYNKPVILFGHIWYENCHSCFNVDSVKSCKKAIKQIINIKKTKVEMDVLRLLMFYKDKLVLGGHGELCARASKHNYQFLVKNLANVLHDKIKSYTT